MSEAFTSATSAAPGKSCPKCSATIPPEAPQGLCPKCLLKQASFPTETGPTTRHTRPAPPDRDELARAFPHLQILELIGQGGMGFVYKARQPKLDRLVALKILAQPLAEQTHFAERFTREGRTLAKLNHPNIVTIHDFGQAGPFFYLLMEYVDGVNLRQAMRAGAVNSTQALAIVPRICEALQYAHNEGVLHRDIKPDNILLDTRGRVKIADFGIAKLMAEAVAENPLTGSGASLGTPHYMAPEQIEKPNAVDHRADIYSLGVVFYEMLTGELPLGRFAAPSEKSAIDPRLDEVVFQTLEKQPERRPQSADEVKTKVETIVSDPTARAAAESQPVTFKMSRCYISTPEFLRTWIGRFFRYTGAGELRLDEENLTFSPRRGNWIVMPLGSITNLSICDLPGWARRFGRGLKLISITFTEKSQTHRLFFIPNKGGFSPIWETNRHVEEWFGAIQNAIKARAGRMPPGSAADIEPLPISSSQPSESFFATVAKAAVLMLILFSVVLIAMFGIYALLRARHQQANTPATPEATAPIDASLPPPLVGPTKTLNLAFDYFGPSPAHNINLKALTDLANDEEITTVIRYNDADWSFTRFISSWDTEEKVVRLHWQIPENFSIPFDLDPAVTGFFHRAPSIPVQLSTNGPLTLFTVTNALKQRVTLGIGYSKHLSTNNQASLSSVTINPSGNGFEISCKPSTPSDQQLYATYIYGDDSQANAPVTRTMPGDELRISWKIPKGFYLHELATITPFIRGLNTGHLAFSSETFELFALTNRDDPKKVWRGFLNIRRVDPLASGGTVVETNAGSGSVAVRSPTAPSRALVFSQVSLKDRIVELGAEADLSFDDMIVHMVQYGDSSWEAERGSAYWISGRDTQPIQRLAYFSWRLPQEFSYEFDVNPALRRFLGPRDRQIVLVQTNAITPLLSITNSLGHVLSWGLRYSKTANSPIDRTDNAQLTGMRARPMQRALAADIDVNLPPDSRLEAIGELDGVPRHASTTRGLHGKSPITFQWDYSPPSDPSRPPSLEYRSTLPEELRQQIQNGGVYFPFDGRFELFSLTNQGQIFRAYLQMTHVNP